jgi:hypothetical protein
MVLGIGPIKVTEICQKLEDNGFVLSEKRSRSLIYTSTPKFAKAFGFDNESRRLKLQMLWRLKRLMGDFEAEEPKDEEDSSIEDEGEDKESEEIKDDSSSTPLDKEATVDLSKDDQVLEEEHAASLITTSSSTNGDIIDIEEDKSETEEPEILEDLSIEENKEEEDSVTVQEGISNATLDSGTRADFSEDDQVLEDASPLITTSASTNGDIIDIEEDKSETEEPEKLEDLSIGEKREEKESEIIPEDSSSATLDNETRVDFSEDDQVLEDAPPLITTSVSASAIEDDKSDFVGDKLKTEPFEGADTEIQPPQVDDYDKTNISEESINALEKLGSISHSNDSDKDKTLKEIKFGNHIEIIEEE